MYFLRCVSCLFYVRVRNRAQKGLDSMTLHDYLGPNTKKQWLQQQQQKLFERQIWEWVNENIFILFYAVVTAPLFYFSCWKRNKIAQDHQFIWVTGIFSLRQTDIKIFFVIIIMGTSKIYMYYIHKSQNVKLKLYLESS